MHKWNLFPDYDRILVLDAGRIAEFDSPDALLADKNSKFFGMMQEHLEQL